MKVIVLVNQSGGSGGDDSRERVTAALRRAGIAGEVELVPGGELARRAGAAVAAGAGLVIAAGGDGTISAVAGALAGTGATLGVIPLGTLNHFARDLGISFDLDEAAATIAAGHQRRVDVARLGARGEKRIFINNSAIGLYPLFVADREGQQDQLGRSKRLSMFVAGLRTLVRFHHHRLTLTINGRSETVETPLLFVGNNDYRIDLGGVGQRDSIRDGRLSVIVMRRMGRTAFFVAIVRAVIGRSRPGEMTKLDDVEQLTVASRRAMLTVSIDGETCAMAPPLDYRIEPAALTVLAPV